MINGVPIVQVTFSLQCLLTLTFQLSTYCFNIDVVFYRPSTSLCGPSTPLYVLYVHWLVSYMNLCKYYENNMHVSHSLNRLYLISSLNKESEGRFKLDQSFKHTFIIHTLSNPFQVLMS